MKIAVPDDEVEAPEATRIAAEKWFPERLLKAPALTAEEQAKLEAYDNGGLGALLNPSARAPDNVPAEIRALRRQSCDHSLLMDDAWNKLRNLMADGLLTGFLFLTANQMTEAAEPIYWTSSNVKHASPHRTGTCSKVISGGYVECRVRIKRADLGIVLTGGKVPPKPKKKDKGGAPRTHDVQAFLIEAFALIYEGFQPRSRDDLNKEARKAYAERWPDADTLTHDWAKPIIRALWERLDLTR
jgi:hypothetical protein